MSTNGKQRAPLLDETINRFAQACHQGAIDGGWWTNSKGKKKRADVPRMLCLIHGEISEALEGYRTNKMDSHLPHRTALEVEMADAVIRIGDLCEALNLDLGGACVEKLRYNKTRPDHTKAARRRKNGKKF